MKAHDHINNLSRYITVFLFSLFSISTLLAFGYYAFNTFLDFLYAKNIIEFNKGAMYMLGVGLSAGLLVMFMIHELQGKEISGTYNKKATRLAFIFIGIVFIFPQIVDYVVSYKIKNLGYVYCQNQSYRWLHAQNKVFGTNLVVCEQFEANEITKISSGC